MGTPNVVATPQISPARCVSCGCGHNTDGRRYIDLGTNVPRYGAVYFCEHCIKEAYSALDIPEAEDLDEISRLYHTNKNLEEENARLRRSLSELDFLGNRGPVDVASPSDAKVGEAKRSAPANAKRSATGKAGPAKPANGQGSGGVQRPNSLDQLANSTSF